MEKKVRKVDGACSYKLSTEIPKHFFQKYNIHDGELKSIFHGSSKW
jgi:hypothetical protein